MATATATATASITTSTSSPPPTNLSEFAAAANSIVSLYFFHSLQISHNLGFVCTLQNVHAVRGAGDNDIFFPYFVNVILLFYVCVCMCVCARERERASASKE